MRATREDAGNGVLSDSGGRDAKSFDRCNSRRCDSGPCGGLWSRGRSASREGSGARRVDVVGAHALQARLQQPSVQHDHIVAQNLADPGQPVTYTKPISALDTSSTIAPPTKRRVSEQTGVHEVSLRRGLRRSGLLLQSRGNGHAGPEPRVEGLDRHPGHRQHDGVAGLLRGPSGRVGDSHAAVCAAGLRRSYSTPQAPFSLRENDHDNLWAERDGSLNTPAVDGRITRSRASLSSIPRQFPRLLRRARNPRSQRLQQLLALLRVSGR